ncbi:type II secretion system protein N [Cypionkella psychrotolerans]|uniref:type II secretion system protein N n=1 Tax=Cypionkella psychrotolerans TaxID=1678131 RepID=UPI0006B4ED43|nr:type II secretion system protein N [Cypionkella psychrotolerans]
MIARIPKLPIWALAAATSISLGASAGPVFWRVSGNDAGVRTASTQTPSAEVARFDLTPILSFMPFGTSVVQAPVQELSGETSLGLVLLGVTLAQPASGSRAIIAGGTGPARAFYIDEDITPTATLAAIEADHVVLDVGGRLETLSFAKRGDAAAVVNNAGPDLRNLIPSAAAAATPAAGSNEPDAVIARYRAAIAMDAQGVLDRLGLQATAQGYRVTENASSGVKQAGFKPGDVVTTVNGQKVGDIPADQSYFDQVAASGRARVELLRDGQTIVMSFPLR